MKVEFTVPGEPKGKGRPQFSTYGGRVTARTPKDTVIYENLVRMEYQRQCGMARFAENAMLKVEVDAYYGIPKSASQKSAARCSEVTSALPRSRTRTTYSRRYATALTESLIGTTHKWSIALSESCTAMPLVWRLLSHLFQRRRRRRRSTQDGVLE